ncbi:MAG: GNAT family N-acetyltransferase [Planctomycetota bacterium]
MGSAARVTNAGRPLRAGRLQPGVLGLMQRVLRPGGDLVAEYPTVLGPDARGEVLWVGSPDLPEAALALEVVRMRGAAKELKLGLVGSVCTAEHARGRGHASALLDLAAERAGAAGCDALMLWPDDAEFYARRGFTEVGTEMDLIFGADRLLHLPRVEARPAGSAEAPELMALYAAHAARTERDVASFARLLNGPELETLVSWDGGDCKAYAVCGRGGDMQGVVHEWGGDFEVVLGLVRAHGERLLLNSAWPDYDLVVLAPPGDPGLVQTAIEFGAKVHLGSLGMARPITPAGAALLEECLPLRNPDETQGFLWGLDSI